MPGLSRMQRRVRTARAHVHKNVRLGKGNLITARDKGERELEGGNWHRQCVPDEARAMRM